MRIRILLAMTLLGGLFGGLLGSGSAQAAGTGTAVVTCTASFPHVPALTWTPGGTCPGSATVAAAGLDDGGAPFTLNGTGNFNAWFEYHEPCLVDGQPAIVLSFARGAFAVNNLPATWNGIPMPATVTGLFSWNRIGLNPGIALANVVVTFANGARSSSPGIGMGTATFVPPGTFNPNTQLLCGQPGGPLAIGVAVAADVSV